MSGNLLDNLDVFYGELTPARATVYARLEGLENYEGLTLSGFVRGPRCFYSKTLPATFRLQDAGPGPSLLAKSLVPDPSYWFPETPHIYDVTVELRKGTEIIASEVRQIGFKPLGISGRFFTWEGKPWVLRGIAVPNTVREIEWKAWREETAAVLVGSKIADEQLEKASLYGIICYCFLTKDHDFAEQTELRRLAKYPAVAIAGLFKESYDDVSRFAPNILRSWPTVTERCLQLPSWAQLAHLFIGNQFGSATTEAKRFKAPVLMDRSASQITTLSEARAACDKLQADLAPFGQFAGYIV